MIDVNVSQDECLNIGQREVDVHAVSTAGVLTLKHAAIDQDRPRVPKMKLVARTGNTQMTAVVCDLHKIRVRYGRGKLGQMDCFPL